MRTKLFIFLFFSISLFAQNYKDLSQKDVFNLGYPAFFLFRGEMLKPNHTSYSAWSSSLSGSTGFIKKLVDEELAVNISTPTWANQYATEHPEKLLLLHFNGQARQVLPIATQNGQLMDRKSVKNLYFPGHWVYEEGSMVTKNILPADTVITVNSTTPYSLQAYKDYNSSPTVYYPSYILLVKLDNVGNRLWYESEVVQLKNLNTSAKTITVERALVNTTALSFEANKTYAAPLDGSVISSMVMWYYNFSFYCPKDSNGKTAADVLTDELSGYFATNGLLSNLNGIAFDVNYFNVSTNTKWDTNNDGMADGGWINNINCWRIGDYAFLKQLRARLGNNYIITADGQHDENQQAVDVLNGIESEGLVQHNDSWRGFSRAINTHLYWKNNTTLSYSSRYVVLKFMNSNDQLNTDRLSRFVTATSSCLEAYNANIPDSTIFPTWMQGSYGLGKPKSDLMRYAKFSTNLQTLTNAQLISKITSSNCNIALVNGNIEVSTQTGYTAKTNMTFSLSNIFFPTGDVTVFIEAQSIDALEGLNSTDKVPRTFYCNLSNLPDYGEGTTVNAFYSDIYGFFGTNKVEEMSFYYRRSNVASGNQTLSFEVTGRGKFIIKSIKIYNQADILVRSFDKGIIVVNPALDNRLVNLKTVFPKEDLTLNDISVNAVDACFFKTNNFTLTPPINATDFVYSIVRISDQTYQLKIDQHENCSLAIFNIVGQQIFRKVITESDNQFSISKNGIFILQIKINDTQVSTVKFAHN